MEISQIRAGVKGGDFLAGSSKAEMLREDFPFHSSKFLDQKNHMYSASLNLLGCFELLAKLHVVAKVVNNKKNKSKNKRKKVNQ